MYIKNTEQNQRSWHKAHTIRNLTVLWLLRLWWSCYESKNETGKLGFCLLPANSVKNDDEIVVIMSLTDRNVTSDGIPPSCRLFAKSAILRWRSFSIFWRSIMCSLCEWTTNRNENINMIVMESTVCWFGYDLDSYVRHLFYKHRPDNRIVALSNNTRWQVVQPLLAFRLRRSQEQNSQFDSWRTHVV